jgi:hypothetical protein
MEQQPAINITAWETLRDGTVNYTCTLTSPGQKPLDMRLSVFKGQPIQCESMEAVRIANEMYGTGLEDRWNETHGEN